MLGTQINAEVYSTRLEDGICVIHLNAGSKFNTLNSSYIRVLEAEYEKLSNDKTVKAVVFWSDKPDSFIIGADLHEIRAMNNEQDIVDLSLRGQELFARFSSKQLPAVAAINGLCLGGGLEFTLTCAKRIAAQTNAATIGLPETRLGLIPGLGGTQRLPRLIGLKAALEMILSAEPVSPDKALELGLVDKIVPASCLWDEAINMAKELAISSEQAKATSEESNLKASQHCRVDLSPESTKKILALTERSVRIKTKGNYPAQTKAVAVIKTGIEKGIEQGLQEEAKAFAELALSEVAANLIALYFVTDFTEQSAASLIGKFPESPVKTLGVIGGGLMGSRIACLAASHGIKTFIRTDASKQENLQERIKQIAHKFAPKRTDANEEATNHLFLPEVITEDEKLRECDLIVECVKEDMAIKEQLLRKISSVVAEDTVIASNTSSLSIIELSSFVAKPERFVGLHFFHPVERMPLVEVISHPATAKCHLARAVSLITSCGKTPLFTKDGPGFLINRLLCCYLFEAARLTAEKYPLNWIEESALQFGMPLGPLELCDEVGWDVAMEVAKELEARLGNYMSPPSIFIRAAALGFQGKKSGKGVYVWSEVGNKEGFNPELVKAEELVVSEDKLPETEREKIIERLILPMIDEAARCLEERVVMKPREIDMAIILGMGFPAFRGGLCRYADKIGLKQISPTLEHIYEKREHPPGIANLIQKYTKENRGFYSRLKDGGNA